MKYISTFFVICFFSFLVSACTHKTITGFCAHPLVMAGIPFPLPDGSEFTLNGSLKVPGKDGSVIYVMHPFCVLEEK